MLPTFFLDSTLLVFICNRVVNHSTWKEFCFFALSVIRHRHSMKGEINAKE